MITPLSETTNIPQLLVPLTPPPPREVNADNRIEKTTEKLTGVCFLFAKTKVSKIITM